jgi:hypothetical protein
MILFALAALIEGYISPSSLPYDAKALAATLSAGALMVFFVLLGGTAEPRAADEPRATPRSPRPHRA